MIGRLIRACAWPYRFLMGAACRIAARLSSADGVRGAKAWRSAGLGRAYLALAWRKLVRWSVVAAGIAVFVGLQLWFAYEINDLRWWFVVGFLMVAVSATVAIARPIWALVAWIVASPIVSKLFNLDWGSGLPAITFDRSVFYFLALSLFIRSLVRRDPPAKLRTGEWLLLAFPVYILLTGPFFPSQSVTSFLLMFMHRAGDVAMLYFLTKASVTESRHASWILAAIVVVGAYCGLMGFYDHFTGRMSIVALVGVSANLIWADVGGGRAAGPFLNPALLAMFLGITFFLCVHYASWVRGRAVRLACYAAVPVMAVSLYWTYTRGGYLLFVVCLLVMPLAASWHRKRYAILLVTAVVTMIAVLPLALSNPSVNSRLTNDRTARGRILAAAALVNTIKSHLWFGVGLGNGNSEMINYVSSISGIPGMVIWEDLGSWNRQFRLSKHTTSHSTYLTVLADHGVVGGIIYFGLFVAFIAHIWRARTRLPSTGLGGKDLAALALAVLLGYIMSINTLRVDSHEYVNYIVWILIALVMRLDDLNRGEASASVVASSVSEPVALGAGYGG